MWYFSNIYFHPEAMEFLTPRHFFSLCGGALCSIGRMLHIANRHYSKLGMLIPILVIAGILLPLAMMPVFFQLGKTSGIFLILFTTAVIGAEIFLMPGKS